MRLGYSLTGRENHPASPEATGLEVDKLDKAAVQRYIETYLDMYKDATPAGKMGAKGLQYMILDSYEAGHMTWTKGHARRVSEPAWLQFETSLAYQYWRAGLSKVPKPAKNSCGIFVKPSVN